MKQSLSHQTIRYGLVGVVVYCVDLGTFAALIALAGDRALVIANIAAKITSAAVGFVLHKYFTFGHRRHDGWARQLALYLLLLGFNTAASTLLVYLCARFTPLPLVLGKICADVVVIAIAFLVSRQIVFRTPVQRAQES